MCEPALVSAAFSGLTIAASTAQQRAQANAAAALQTQIGNEQNRRAVETAKRNNAKFLRDAARENFQQQQEDEQASQRLQSSQKEALQARARTRVATGEAGISGLSVGNLIADFFRQEDLFKEAIRQNREFGRFNSQLNIDAIQAGADNSNANLRQFIPRPIRQPNFLGAAFRIAKPFANEILKND